jgi:murein DD-endopeptidase MepM/ murein hydrolase activator NlpD
LYGHLTKVNVEPGQTVKAGDVVGFLGSTGRSTGPHLHYEIRKNGIDIDPTSFLKIY